MGKKLFSLSFDFVRNKLGCLNIVNPPVKSDFEPIFRRFWWIKLWMASLGKKEREHFYFRKVFPTVAFGAGSELPKSVAHFSE